jgi:hypothetical protein
MEDLESSTLSEMEIQLELPHTLLAQLCRERRMAVPMTVVDGALGLEVIGVVCAPRLNMVQTKLAVERAARWQRVGLGLARRNDRDEQRK